MALTTNLIAAYNFDTTTGNLVDSSGGGFTLTNNNSVTFPAGLIGEGAGFGTANTNKSLSNSSNVTIDGGAMSVSLWIKLSADITASSWGLFNQGRGAGNHVDYFVNYNYNGGTRQLVFSRHRMGTGDEMFTTNATLGTTWNHIVMTYNGTSTITGYLNGVNLGNDSAGGNGSTDDGFTGTFIGRNPRNSIFTDGTIDMFNVWNREITQAEVTELYNGGAGLQYPFIRNTSAFMQFIYSGD